MTGRTLDQADTPALWVDLDVLESNIGTVASELRSAGVAWRPQTKAGKSPDLARKLIAAGAIGVTCAKLGEAEVMADAGITDILIANQVVGPIKLRRLVNLCRRADVMVAVDSDDNARAISDAASAAGVLIRVLIEVDLGLRRCGRQPGDDTAAFAARLAALPGIRLCGLMAWEGHVLAIADAAERRAACIRAVETLVNTAEQCRRAGAAVPIVCCSGSGTYAVSAHVPGVTEVQAGGGVFGDRQYQGWGLTLSPCLFLRCIVVSRPAGDRAILDAGFKTAGAGFALPAVRGVAGATLTAVNSEHGIVKVEGDAARLRVGDPVDLIVGYSDATIHLHDRLLAVRGGVVEAAWPISARGRSD